MPAQRCRCAGSGGNGGAAATDTGGGDGAAAAAPNGSTSTSSSSSAQAPAGLPPGYWEEGRVRYNRMRHERDRANKKRAREQLQQQQQQQQQQTAPPPSVVAAAAANPDAPHAHPPRAAARGPPASERRRAAVAAALAGAAPRVVIDCSYATRPGPHAARFGARASEAAARARVRSLAKQIEVSMALNRRAARPLGLTLACFCGDLAAFCDHMGAAAWAVERHEGGVLEVFGGGAGLPGARGGGGDRGGGEGGGGSGSGAEGGGGGEEEEGCGTRRGGSSGTDGFSGAESSGTESGGVCAPAAAGAPPQTPRPRRLVLLSPDADAPLAGPLDPRTAYVIGGIVDKSVVKGLSLGWAASAGVAAARLPVREHAHALGMHFDGANKTPVLAVNEVVAVLLAAWANGGDWGGALAAALPPRLRRGGGGVN
ncbi:tRNA methyltransferase [Raphidocelis subcapitata]|uniref:tRNA (guanine(9)-N(1))-methyltransferase n=1 Tax=Raphidocelis subcapitata TaxID=307507 RepID=A0A2V0NQV0_9CHLO|nr:tRNA methyltransferase [Raphidocelis subcapitata]|eukprot:GBF90048.1 tRNA methyltransferase [Raphidocelis subcapitata]